jgi:diacylglycerol kinase family enzyme
MEIPADLEAACRLAVRGRDTRRLDLGRMGERPFVNVASAGLAPVAASEAGSLKRPLGPLAYSIGAQRAGLRARPLRCTASCEGAEAFSGLAWQVTVACSGAFGGGASLDADPADGALDLAVIEAGPRLQLLRRAYGMRRGTVGRQQGVTTARCKTAEIDVADGTPFNVDGELIESGPTSFSVQAAAFELVVPTAT